MSRQICSASRILLIGAMAFFFAARGHFAACAADNPYGAQIPVTGEMVAGSEELARLDKVMKEILARHEVPGAALAITHNGKLLVARGYGWADVAERKPVEPTTLFGLASVSKAITAATVLKLVEDGKLKLDQHVLELMGELKAPPGRPFDPRLREITVRMLLEHAGGWNRDKSGDPTRFGEKVHNELHVPMPVTIDQLIYYMNGQPLDFDPGTQQHYSNYGFAILGGVIEHLTKEPYVTFVDQVTLHPMGIKAIKMSATLVPGKEGEYLPNEAKRYVAGTTKPLEAGHIAESGSAGGWCGSAVAVARFMTAIDGTRTEKPFLNAAMMREMLARPQPPLEVRKNGAWFGLGWDAVREMPNWPFTPTSPGRAGSASDRSSDDLAYGKDGGLPGISTWVQHLPGGIDWVVLFNGSKRGKAHPEDAENPSDDPKGNALQDAQKEVLETLRDVKQWPKGDLFEKWR